MPEIVNPLLDPVYEAPKGSKFKIVADGSLFVVRMMNGGVPPAFTEQKFTTLKKAKMEIEKHFRNNPKPVPRDTVKKSG